MCVFKFFQRATFFVSTLVLGPLAAAGVQRTRPCSRQLWIHSKEHGCCGRAARARAWLRGRGRRGEAGWGGACGPRYKILGRRCLHLRQVHQGIRTPVAEGLGGCPVQLATPLQSAKNPFVVKKMQKLSDGEGERGNANTFGLGVAAYCPRRTSQPEAQSQPATVLAYIPARPAILPPASACSMLSAAPSSNATSTAQRLEASASHDASVHNVFSSSADRSRALALTYLSRYALRLFACFLAQKDNDISAIYASTVTPPRAP